MKSHGKQFVQLRWGVLPLIAVALGACTPAAKDVMQRSFDLDPPVQVEYQLDGSRLYKTRNIVLIADYGRSELSSLVMLVALSGEPTSEDSVGHIGGLIKFRSIDRIPHFESERDLSLTIGGQHHELGPCAYAPDTLPKGGKIEELTVVVSQSVVHDLATADQVQGKVGPVSFELVGEQLLPIRALADTLNLH
jgi:hypothetical protein